METPETLPPIGTLTHPWKRSWGSQELCTLPRLLRCFVDFGQARCYPQRSSGSLCQAGKGTKTTQRDSSQVLGNGFRNGIQDSYHDFCHAVVPIHYTTQYDVKSKRKRQMYSFLTGQRPTIAWNGHSSSSATQRQTHDERERIDLHNLQWINSDLDE